MSNGMHVVVLFGSRARGDCDDFSDEDVLVVTDDTSSREFHKPDVTPVVHDWREFQAMRDYGSLFLLHLQLEARVLSGTDAGKREYRTLTSSLPNYCRAASDIRIFERALLDASESISRGDGSVWFEMSSVATVCRHACILGCYLLGYPDFGRYSAVQSFCERTGVGAELASVFPALYGYRMEITRGCAPEAADMSAEAAISWCDKVSDLLSEVKNVANSRGLYQSNP